MKKTNELLIENLWFSYEKNLILKGINFSIEKGELCGILGPNGTGKTTLFKCIQGILKPYNGEVLLDGVSIKNMNYKDISKKISTVPQQISVPFSYTVLDIILMAKISKMKLFSSPTIKDRDEVIDILKSIGMDYFKEKIFNELSGGQKQLILIARAIYQNTPIVLLDEPTSHLDYKNQITIMKTIKKVIKNKKLAGLINIHDPNVAFQFCDTIIMLKEGKVLMKGKTENIICSQYLTDLYDMDINVDTTLNGRKVILPCN